MARTGPVTTDPTAVALGLAQIRIGSSAANIANTSAVLASTDSIGALANTKFTGATDFFKLESGFPLLEDAVFPLREAAALECAFKQLTPFNLAVARGINPMADVSATETVIDQTTTSGTTTELTVPIVVTDNAGPVNDTWTVVFATATTGAIYGQDTGHVHTFADLTTAIAPLNGAIAYFTIPANYFTGTWAADEIFVFRTTAFVAGTSAYANAHSGSIGLGAVAAPADIRMEAVYTFPNGTDTMSIIFPRGQVPGSVEMDFASEEPAAVTIMIEAKRADSEITGGHLNWDTMPIGRIVWA